MRSWIRKPSAFILLLSACVLLLVSSNLNWPKDYWKGILRSDARGYYAWLPAVFIYQDLSFEFQNTVENPQTDPRHQAVYRIPKENSVTNKYFCGTALAELPFFLTAHILTLLSSGNADGYSFLYQLFINLAGIFYALCGLYFLRRLLLQFKFSESTITWTLIAILFATNLFYYSIIEPGMSHVFSFAFVSAFLFYTHAWFRNPQTRLLLLASVCFGMIILIRPVNGFILLATPLLASSWDDFLMRIRSLLNSPKIIFPILITSSIIAIQPILWKIQTGNFFLDSYPGEDFHFLQPHLIDFLFSYKKGAFLYTPLLAVGLAGYLFLPKEKRPQLVYGSAWGLALVYILSSWWNWWYGGSFSSRVLVEYLPVFAIGLAIPLHQKRSWIKIVSRTLVVLLLLVCQVQIYQYRYYQIHWEEMTAQRYWDVFLRPDLK